MCGHGSLGYLCCDCMNKTPGVEVFDKEVAQILFSMAQLYGNFLETLNSNWIDRAADVKELPQSFLNLVYNNTFVGTNGRKA